ncbi:hypothetical protein G6014_11565 [Dietzia kunjamensis]|nr:hypothetical protein [Dietzia kunjamensis]MBB1012900.1 hypothetical protein [Dietzia kunjamensis]
MATGTGMGSSATSGSGIDSGDRGRHGAGAAAAGASGVGAGDAGGRHARTDDVPGGSDPQARSGHRTGTPGDTVDPDRHPDDKPGIVDKMLGRTRGDEPRH